MKIRHLPIIPTVLLSITALSFIVLSIQSPMLMKQNQPMLPFQ